jgi:predicted component of type VI protein secretion system
MHASMRFAAGRWHIKNLSATNPVVVNGQQLPANGDGQLLNDGDQVEMGEVIFRFRPR